MRCCKICKKYYACIIGDYWQPACNCTKGFPEDPKKGDSHIGKDNRYYIFDGEDWIFGVEYLARQSRNSS